MKEVVRHRVEGRRRLMEITTCRRGGPVGGVANQQTRNGSKVPCISISPSPPVVSVAHTCTYLYWLARIDLTSISSCLSSPPLRLASPGLDCSSWAPSQLQRRP